MELFPDEWNSPECLFRTQLRYRREPKYMGSWHHLPVRYLLMRKDSMKKCSLCAAVVLISVMSLFAQDKRRQFDPDEAYKNTCMRCHTSTQQYFAGMTKTVVMHMRVRSNLTQHY